MHRSRREKGEEFEQAAKGMLRKGLSKWTVQGHCSW
uniref:Uncharacterized protein n=1 Tax=Arundo donax TaxID=35708 RepID=A0A0A9AN14_ARUDO